jgi:SAM-dependent methyltransferase
VGVSGWIWNAMYRQRPSWDLDAPDPELLRTLEDRDVRGPGRAIDLGCGTGDNAVALAQRGFEVTAIDIADRALARAHEKAAAAGVSIELREADATGLDDLDAGTFDLVVDRGLLMSLLGERARRAYSSTIIRLTAADGNVYQHQWVLPETPRAGSPTWLVSRAKGILLAPGELDRRLGQAFSVEVLSREVAPADDPGMRRIGIRQVAKTTYWLTRRSEPPGTHRPEPAPHA